jgi:hypothetical protein
MVDAVDLKRRGCVQCQVHMPSVLKWRVCSPNTGVSHSGWKRAWQKRGLESSRQTQQGVFLWRSEAQFRYKQSDPRTVSTKETFCFVFVLSDGLWLREQSSKISSKVMAFKSKRELVDRFLARPNSRCVLLSTTSAKHCGSFRG